MAQRGIMRRLGSMPSTPAMHPSAVYKYDSITKDQIRLVTIQPALNTNDPIVCWITSEERSDQCAYAALSYTWGDPSNISTILCNESTFHTISSNCEAAMRALRYLTEPVTMWIDAVCINQADNDERNAQVERIGDVYRLANKTFAFLGPSDRIYNLRGEIAEWEGLLEREWFKRTWVVQEVVLSRDVILVVGTQRIPLSELVFQCFWRKVKMPPLIAICNELVGDYTSEHSRRPNEESDDDFSEDWTHFTISSVNSNSDDTVVGSSTRSPVDTNDTAGAGMASKSILGGPAGEQPMESLVAPPLPRRPALMSGSSILDPVTHGSTYAPLEYSRLPDIMNRTRGLGCQDPRDKLFAVLSLFISPIPGLLRPDYKKSVEDVYKDLSWFLLSTHLVDALSYVNSANSELPSWVPDWRQPLVFPDFQRFRHKELWRAGYQVGQQGNRFSNPIGLNSRCISQRGLELGDIRRVERYYRFRSTFRAAGREQEVEVRVKSCSEPHTADGSWVSISFVWPRQSAEFDDVIRSGAKRLIDHVERNARRVFSGERMSFSDHRGDVYWQRPLRDAAEGPSTVLPAVKRFFDQFYIGLVPGLSLVGEVKVSSEAETFTVCATDAHRLLDMENMSSVRASNHVEPGDRVSILLGYPMPFVLRAKGRMWWLVGECLFDVRNQDLMHGAVVDQLHWNKVWETPLPTDSLLQDFIIG